jgi:hypothetical protein
VAPAAPDATRRALSLATPKDTVATQVRLLAEGDDEGFRATFLPDVRARVTPDAIRACKQRVAGRGVFPDWETAEDAVESGQRVRRVSMYGKSLTGFHEVATDVWLVDAVWCVPIYQGPPGP